MRPLVDDVVNLPPKHLEAAGINLDHYKRIKQEEQEARARLMSAARNENMMRYRPSNNALAAYSPLRNDFSRHSYAPESIVVMDDVSKLRAIF
jgi:hypothetical protein